MIRNLGWLIWLLVAVGVGAQTGSLLEKADAAFREGDFKQAGILAQRVLAQDPRSVHARLILGLIAAESKQWPTSTKHFQEVIRLDPSNAHGYFYLGQASLYQQQWNQAIEYFTKAHERHYPNQERLAIELGLAQNEAGRPQEAMNTLAKVPAPAEGPLAAQYHAVGAFALTRLNLPAKAIELMRRARDLDDANTQYWEFLISVLISTDQTPAALAEAIQAQKKFPDNPEILFLFGLASYYVPESPLTKLALRNLREAEPDGARVLLVEGMLHRKQGHSEDALRAFKAAASRDLPDAHLLLGILLREDGDHEGAERELRAAEGVNPQNGQVMLELGKVLVSRGEFAQARERLERAVEYMPSNFAVHYQLGLAYRRLGENQKAEHHLKLSRELEASKARATAPPR
jgi:tetratricopeptide (TPR) repeat protein